MRQAAADTFGPRTFVDYLKDHNLPKRTTASLISVDSISRLAPDLAKENVMVFRLGSHSARNCTSFALARCREGWGDFFLQDNQVFESVSITAFSSTAADLDLAAFKHLPRLTECSVVNLALASGVLGEALRLDDPRRAIVPATAQSTFTFDVKAYEDTSSWNHRRGQVEIDSIFFAKRHGVELLFAVEAKQSDKLESLAKHKLVYPTIALRSVMPRLTTQIVPVYLRAIRNRNSWDLFICECSLPFNDSPAISSLTATGKPCAFRLEL